MRIDKTVLSVFRYDFLSFLSTIREEMKENSKEIATGLTKLISLLDNVDVDIAFFTSMLLFIYYASKYLGDKGWDKRKISFIDYLSQLEGFINYIR